MTKLQDDQQADQAFMDELFETGRAAQERPPTQGPDVAWIENSPPDSFKDFDFLQSVMDGES